MVAKFQLKRTLIFVSLFLASTWLLIFQHKSTNTIDTDINEVEIEIQHAEQPENSHFLCHCQSESPNKNNKVRMYIAWFIWSVKVSTMLTLALQFLHKQRLL